MPESLHLSTFVLQARLFLRDVSQRKLRTESLRSGCHLVCGSGGVCSGPGHVRRSCGVRSGSCDVCRSGRLRSRACDLRCPGCLCSGSRDMRGSGSCQLWPGSRDLRRPGAGDVRSGSRHVRSGCSEVLRHRLCEEQLLCRSLRSGSLDL